MEQHSKLASESSIHAQIFYAIAGLLALTLKDNGRHSCAAFNTMAFSTNINTAFYDVACCTLSHNFYAMNRALELDSDFNIAIISAWSIEHAHNCPFTCPNPAVLAETTSSVVQHAATCSCILCWNRG